MYWGGVGAQGGFLLAGVRVQAHLLVFEGNAFALWFEA